LLPRRAPRGALDSAIHALGALVDGRLQADFASYSSQVELIVLPAPNSLEVQPTDFNRSARLISKASVASRAVLARGEPFQRHLSLATRDELERSLVVS
jgi:NTE family protein